MSSSDAKTEEYDQDIDDEKQAALDEAYVAPKEASIADILSKDQGDAELEEYKRKLLGNAVGADGKGVAAFPEDARRLIIDNITIRFDDNPNHPEPVVMRPDSGIKYRYTIKEGATFKVFVSYYVQHEIVSGLRFFNAVSKFGVNVEKTHRVLGSFAPRLELYEVQAITETAPSGFFVRSKFQGHVEMTDDDKFKHLDFSYELDIKKNWD